MKKTALQLPSLLMLLLLAGLAVHMLFFPPRQRGLGVEFFDIHGTVCGSRPEGPQANGQPVRLAVEPGTDSTLLFRHLADTRIHCLELDFSNATYGQFVFALDAWRGRGGYAFYGEGPVFFFCRNTKYIPWDIMVKQNRILPDSLVFRNVVDF